MLRQSPSGLFEILQEEDYSEQLARIRESVDLARTQSNQGAVAGCDTDTSLSREVHAVPSDGMVSLPSSRMIARLLLAHDTASSQLAPACS
jgi:hypothetical protein